MMKIKQSTTPRPPEPPPQPLPVPPEHCRWILLEDACGPNEKMLDFVATGPDGNTYKLCCDVTARKGRPQTLAAMARPTTRRQRLLHNRALWRGATRSPTPMRPRVGECIPPERKCPDGMCLHKDLMCAPFLTGNPTSP